MSTIRSLANAMIRGFLRDRQALFFTILFPLIFLFLFGGIFSDPSQSKSDLTLIGKVPLVDELPPQARSVFDDLFKVHRTRDRADAIRKVRDGTVDGALEQRGNTVILHFSRADPVEAASVQGTLSSFVDQANVHASGTKPVFSFAAKQVEDEALSGIQYVAPGLLGWAIATSATFGSALTLVTWRQSELLRRLRLAPVTAIVLARVIVSILIALAQTVLFVVLSVVVFDLKLTGNWYLSVPLIIAGTLTFMAIGLFCGAVAKTSEGASGLANLLVLPMAFLSGSFIPLDVAPAWIRTVSLVFPLRYLNDGMLDVMVRGKGPGAIVVPMLVMIGFAAVVGGLSGRFIRWDKA